MDEPRAAPAAAPVRGRAPLVALCSLAAMLAATPLLAWSTAAVLGRESSSPLDWVSLRFGPRAEYAEFSRRFESGSVAVATWRGCELDSAALPALAEACVGPDGPRDARGRPWFDSAVSGPAILARLVGPPVELDREEAIRRLRGVLVGPDGRTTCLVVGFTREGIADRRAAVAWLRRKSLEATGVAEADLHVAGPMVENVEIDSKSNETLLGLAPWVAIVILSLTWFSLRSAAYAGLVFFVAAWSVGLAFLTMDAAGDRMNPVLVVMPVLVLVLGVSAGIHLVNYLAEARAAGPDRVAGRAIRLGFMPCLLSAGTTAIGLVSLVVSELEPIRVFGLHGAIGVMGSLVAGFLVLPGLYERWPPRRTGGTLADGEPAAGRRVADAVVRHAGPIVAVCFAAMAAAGAGVSGVRTSVRLDRLFAADSRLIRDYAWIEDHVGPTVPIEVVVAFGPDSDVRVADRVAIVRRVGERLAGMPGVRGVLSAAAFLPEEADAGALRTAARRVITARRLAQQLAAIDDLKYVRAEAGGERWRATARVPVLADIDYGDFLERVRVAVAPVVEEAGGAGRGVSFSCTGVMPVVHAIQNALLADLFVSFFSALALITVVMMVVERGVAAGLVAMVSNVFPMLLVFGVLGWWRARLDIGSGMTASIALGMAIDGTLHFLTFFRRSRDAGADAAAAVRAAYAHCAAAMTQGTVACGLGMLLFAASSYVLAQRFAWMIVTLMALALAGDLVLLPAMLVGRLGRVFAPARRG
ncbi:MAG: efflux RND transporter permease subunit [Planctomycetaceae bacterium]